MNTEAEAPLDTASGHLHVVQGPQTHSLPFAYAHQILDTADSTAFLTGTTLEPSTTRYAATLLYFPHHLL
ncbi:unnamed protein product [Merluccius merluccius]